MEVGSPDVQNQEEMGSSEEWLKSLSAERGAHGNLTTVGEQPHASFNCEPQETNTGGILVSCNQVPQGMETEHPPATHIASFEVDFCKDNDYSTLCSPVPQKCRPEAEVEGVLQNNGIVEVSSELTLPKETSVPQNNQLEEAAFSNEPDKDEVILMPQNCKSEEANITGAPSSQLSTPKDAKVTETLTSQISTPEEAESNGIPVPLITPEKAEGSAVPVPQISTSKDTDTEGILPQDLAESLSETRDNSSDRELSDSASTDNTLEDSNEFTQHTLVGSGSLTQELAPVVVTAHRDDDVTAEGWRARRKHVFVLSEAGKPIYSRYGNEEALSSTMGVMMALVSFVQTGNNCIRSIYSADQKVVFLQQGPLVLVSVSRTLQSEQQLRRELMYVYYQIISMLTQASISRIFERKKNYDLRRLLAGSEKILDSLLDLLERDAGFLLGAVQCLALPASLRDSLSSILQKAITTNLVFSILVARSQLVTIVQERAIIEDCRLDPADLHLLLNLIGASSAFQAGEIWTPICLPRFNPDCYFYAYISYLDPACTVCLILLSTDKESFYSVSGCKKKAEEIMRTQGSLQALTDGLQGHSYSAAMVGIPDLWHFMYKPMDIPDNYKQLAQFTSPETEGPYAREEERQRLFDLYRYLHSRLHSTSRPLRLIYHMTEKETLLAWVTSKFELYTSFSPLVTKAGAISVVTKLLHWLKKEEDRLFIRYPPKYSTTPAPSKGAKAGRAGDRTDTARGENGFFSGL
ncbi:vacuolar fusion protein MON1 homolog B-like [Rhinatrema bivittatum]|uniref:vacuolar fusion protein MON1 homolog B-like n=1 Tax=Rhinatrema bivittatum TaxID=194408 RepID=UPI00112ED1B1|nr:vacuolar fusion protein MON1 homolog B-like [Rhinatrema bivittatum]